MRAFIGIDFAPEVKKEIFNLQQRLRKYALRGRWKHSDNFHLTLKFLDEISLTQQAQINEAMQKVCLGQKPFKLAVTSLGVFNGKEAIRVLWLGLTGDLFELKGLQRQIDQALGPLGFAPEKRQYSPHITIGQDVVFACGFDQIRESIGDVHLGTIGVDRFFLYKSEQIERKRIYSPISEYKLHME